MSALTVTWPCPECDEQLALTASVTSTDLIRDETGKVTGITLVPEIDTAPALAHLVDAHAWTPTT